MLKTDEFGEWRQPAAVEGATDGGDYSARLIGVTPSPDLQTDATDGTARQFSMDSDESRAAGGSEAFLAGSIQDESAIASQHLLVVDDDESVRKACSEVARRMGFHVHEAESVPAARAALKRMPIDLLLLDMKLPGGGGLLLLEETKALHPETESGRASPFQASYR